MTLKNNFYDIISRDEKNALFTLRLHPESTIYQAHFPGHPVTPGVCLVQMALELLSELTGSKATLREAKNVKFVSVVSPTETPTVTFAFKNVFIDDNELTAQLTVSAAEEVKAKMSLICNLSL